MKLRSSDGLRGGEAVGVALGLAQAARKAGPHNADELVHVRKHPPHPRRAVPDAVTTCVPSGLNDAELTGP